MPASKETLGHVGAQRPALVAVRIGVVLLVTLNLGLFLRARMVPTYDNFLTRTPAWVFGFVASTVVLVLLAVTAWFTARREQALDELTETLLSLERVTEAALEQLTLDELLDTLAVRIRELLPSDEVAVFLAVDDNRLIRRAVSRGPSRAAPSAVAVSAITQAGASGDPSPGPGDLELAFGAGLVGQAATTARTLVGPHVSEPAAFPRLGHEVEATTGLSAACPMVVNGQVIGVVRARFDQPRSVADEDVRLLRVATERVTSAVASARLYEAERRSRMAAEHARGHMALIAAASELFDSAMDDHEPVLYKLADIVVPGFADWCLIDLADGEGVLTRIASVHSDAALGASLDRLIADHPHWDELAHRVMAQGQGELRFGLDLPAEPRSDFVEVMRGLKVESVMMSAIRVRGLSLGAITMGRGRQRRGFRPLDLTAAEDVARRAAVAIERVLLYRETREAARVASRTANQLRRLMQAAPEITAPLSTREVLEELAAQARLVLDAGRAVVVLPTEDLRIVSPASAADALPDDDGVRQVEDLLAQRLDVGRRAADPSLPARPGGPGGVIGRDLASAAWQVALIASPTLDVVGAIVVSDKRQGVFTDEDEALLVSMAQMAAAALENARLYHVVETSEERLRALVEAAPLAIVELGLGGEVRSWNRAARQMFAWPEPYAEVDDPVLWPAFPASVDASLRALWAGARAGQPVEGAEISGEGPDRRRLELTVAAAPLRDGEGQVNGVLAVLADVTDRKDLELRLLASQRLEAIGRLAGGIAHDFNNLLTVILGYSDLALRRMGPGDELRSDVEAIRNAGDQAARLTHQLLAIGRHQVSESTVVSVPAIVGSIEAVLHRLMTDDIILEIDIEAAWVLIDPSQLEQVVLNLVVNAGDSMPRGGRIRVRGRQERLEHPEPVGVGVVQPGTWVVLSVEDEGTGMDPEVLEHCFEPFFTTKDQSTGTGLGLATVYGIVDQNGGAIRIGTVAGAGTTVTVFLPAVHDDFDEVPDSESPDWLAPGTECILLVEDEDTVRELTAEVLSAHGYMMIEAADGMAAMAMAAEHPGAIDLLVTDVVMPGMDGLELARRMQQSRPGLPVLYISGYTGKAWEELQALAQTSNFLAKPFKPDELVRRVRELLDSRARAEKI